MINRSSCDKCFHYYRKSQFYRNAFYLFAGTNFFDPFFSVGRSVGWFYVRSGERESGFNIYSNLIDKSFWKGEKHNFKLFHTFTTTSSRSNHNHAEKFENSNVFHEKNHFNRKMTQNLLLLFEILNRFRWKNGRITDRNRMKFNTV